MLPVARDGSLSPPTAVMQHYGSSSNPSRQKEAHAHSINLDADNRLAVAADLGLDKLMLYRFDANAVTLVTNSPAFTLLRRGSGPRHFAFHPNGRSAYVINELSCTVTALRYDRRKGEFFEEQSISTLPRNENLKPEYSTAEIQVHPSGRFLYGSNRGHDSIAIFSIAKSGKLALVDHTPTGGRTPRNFGLDPTGRFLLAANQATDSVVVFSIDEKTGRLTPTGQKVDVGSPVCVKFVVPK
jgi:6-phosphogluconolactonase